jgi:menaquinol-cytochrome c reductase iron-sulfur subunit
MERALSKSSRKQTTRRKSSDLDAGRRTFFARLTVGLSGVIGAVLSLPAVVFVFGPLLRLSPRKWRDVGEVDAFEIGATTLVEYEDPSPLPWAGVTAKTGAWLRRVSETEFIAFSINCRHLGCPVRWVAGAELFMCPCHGGVYYKDGEVAAGPPPQALARYPVRVHKTRVQIETSPVPLPGHKN